MKRHELIAGMLWLYVVGSAVAQGLAPDPQPLLTALRFEGTGLVAITMPFVFFACAPFFLKGHPFDVPPLRAWVNRRFGKGTYEAYTRAIRPLLLFAASSLILGLTKLSTAIHSEAPPGAYVVGAFFISAAVGIVACRAQLRRRGNSIE